MTRKAHKGNTEESKDHANATSHKVHWIKVAKPTSANQPKDVFVRLLSVNSGDSFQAHYVEDGSNLSWLNRLIDALRSQSDIAVEVKVNDPEEKLIPNSIAGSTSVDSIAGSTTVKRGSVLLQSITKTRTISNVPA